MRDRLDELLTRERFAILDGGLATQLERRGCELDDPLWSAKLLIEDPELLVAVHREWIEAGADIVCSASYQATIPALVERGLDEATARRLLARSVELVREAAPEICAASVGSYGAYLADGSEYRGGFGLSLEGLRDFHRPRMQALAEAGPDLLAFETIPDATELRAIAQLLHEAGPRAWVSLSMRPGAAQPTLADGSPLELALEPLLAHPRVAAIGVNCLGPSEVLPALQRLDELAPDLPKIVYPNSGERWVQRGWTGEGTSPETLAELARSWLDHGARIIGGCCRTGPEHIRALVELRRLL